jgi:non-ribosomal peptide synthetase component E (peptide arylation enzyme)
MSISTLAGTSPEERYSPELLATFRAHYWDPTSLSQYIDRYAAENPDRVSVTDGYGTLTRAELRGQAYRFALSLKELGIGEGDRVQVQLPNWNEFVVVYIALSRIGAIIVPNMPVYRAEEVRFAIQNSGARLSIVAEEFHNFRYVDMIEETRNQTPSLENVIVVRGTDSSKLSFEVLSAGDRTPTPDELGPTPSPDALNAVIYTSGTESRPKGCQHTFGTISFTAKRLAQDVLHMDEDSVMFAPSPITHATGLAAGIATPLMAGAAIHLMDQWEPVAALGRIAEYRTTHTLAATPFLQMTLGALKAHPEADISSMRVWGCAGAPIPGALLREWKEAVPGCFAVPIYGSSEGLVITAVRFGDDEEKVLGSDGRGFDGIQLELRDEDDHVVANGDEGEINYLSPGMFLGYWQDPEKTAVTIGADGFARSGDLARMDADGYIRVTGRIKDLIIRGGLNISAREVEENVAAHPAVAAVAVVSVPDERLGEKACACIVANGEQLTLVELGKFLREERGIMPQKFPEQIMYVDELPMTATGKVKKFELRLAALEAAR